MYIWHRNKTFNIALAPTMPGSDSKTPNTFLTNETVFEVNS